jgi:hypothetical protein
MPARRPRGPAAPPVFPRSLPNPGGVPEFEEPARVFPLMALRDLPPTHPQGRRPRPVGSPNDVSSSSSNRGPGARRGSWRLFESRDRRAALRAPSPALVTPSEPLLSAKARAVETHRASRLSTPRSLTAGNFVSGSATRLAHPNRAGPPERIPGSTDEMRAETRRRDPQPDAQRATENRHRRRSDSRSRTR